MGVTLRRERDGTLRPFWYGEFTEADGTRKTVNLALKWRGTPPESLLETRDRPGRPQSGVSTGDTEFEASREEAEKKLAEHVEEARHKGRVEHLTERLIESKSGAKVEYVALSDLFEKWTGTIPERCPKCKTKIDKAEFRGACTNANCRKSLSKYSLGYVAQCKALFARFVAFMQERNPKARYLYQVKPADVQAFCDKVGPDMSAATFSVYIGILRPAFDLCLPAGAVNPFRSLKRGARQNQESHTDDTVHRRPFTAEELQKLLDAARGDDFMFPLITAGACTGMRRGDLCKLQWNAVDLAGGMLTVKTSKTGAQVEIPIFKPLRAVLESRRGQGTDYVFPEAERMLRENPTGLTYRFKCIVAHAFDTENKELLPPVFATEAEGVAAIVEKIPEGERRERMLSTFTRYTAGESLTTICKTTGIYKATVSGDLHAVEEWTGKTVLRPQGDSVKKAIARVTQLDREQGTKSASILDFHALRTTFVTIALSAGVPMEHVRRITGHTTVDIVLKNYFRPGREQFRAVLDGAMPDVLTGGKAKKLKPADELAALIGKVQAGSATTEEKKRLRVLAAKV